VSPSRRLLAALFAALVVAAGALSGQAAADQAIIGGGEADQAYPFMVSLQSVSGEHECGAALIEPDWVVTAAHCVQGRKPDTVTMRVGSNDRTRGGETATGSEVVVHPDYDPATGNGDIALVRLAAPVEAAPVALGTSAAVGTATRLLGWGQTCPTQGCGEAPVMLRALDTTIVDPGACTANISSATQLCTGDADEKAGSCYGDSGGPQITRVDGGWRLLGVTSRSGNDDPVCATGPSIYTSTVAYSTWIGENTT
jgi:secreted trypsin-like serine protease